MKPSLEGRPNQDYRGTFSPWVKTDRAGHQPSISMSWGQSKCHYLSNLPSKLKLPKEMTTHMKVPKGLVLTKKKYQISVRKLGGCLIKTLIWKFLVAQNFDCCVRVRTYISSLLFRENSSYTKVRASISTLQ